MIAVVQDGCQRTDCNYDKTGDGADGDGNTVVLRVCGTIITTPSTEAETAV